MRRFSLLVGTLCMTPACAPGPANPADGSTTTTSSSSPGPSSTQAASESSSSGDTAGETRGGADTSGSSGVVPLAPIPLQAVWLETLAGPWVGSVADTPMGTIPQFGWAFEWDEAGDLVAVADNGMGFRFEFRFAQDDGQWTLVETGAMPGGFEQSYTLHPVDQDGARVRFELLDRPGFLSVEMGVIGETLGIDVLLRGEPHATFDLAPLQ